MVRVTGVTCIVIVQGDISIVLLFLVSLQGLTGIKLGQGVISIVLPIL